MNIIIESICYNNEVVSCANRVKSTFVDETSVKATVSLDGKCTIEATFTFPNKIDSCKEVEEKIRACFSI